MKKAIILSCATVLLFGFSAFVLLFFGVFQINNPSEKEYPIRGVDVSHYQGEIDWSVLSQQGIRFAFIKATEGSSHIDERFMENWDRAAKTDLRIGAYHFFSFESAGKTQAANFCSRVTAVANMLPPVVDVEPYGTYSDIDHIIKKQVMTELMDYLSIVGEKYGIKPIIYTTEDLYNTLIAGNLSGYDIWIRSVYSQPSVNTQWTFWQYTNRKRLAGYLGDERYIDMNVFNGSEADFEAYSY